MRRTRWRAIGFGLGSAALVLVLAGAIAVRRATAAGALPRVPSKAVFATLFDPTPVRLSITEQWQKVGLVEPAYLITSDETLWRKMHFEDWDTVPARLRAIGLTAMVARYRWAVSDAARWRRMQPRDWDEVPQPIRAMAFIRMARYWSARQGLTGAAGADPQLAGDTLAAIVMAESWFEHRAAYRNPDGTVDLGLGGSSEYCRTVLREHPADAAPAGGWADEDYLNPWDATRAAAAWLAIMVREADGDFDLAVRAYHVGIGRARRGAGRAYADSVADKRRRYIADCGAPPSWNFVFRLVFVRSIR